MSVKIKQAVILSAGFGSRLRPMTDTMPKVMVPFLGKPLLEHHIEQYKKFGVSEFFINLHYLPEVIKSYFGDGSKFGVSITYAYEDPILGTAGGMKDFEGKLKGDFFLIYGDVFSQVDYQAMADAYYKTPANRIGMELIGQTDHPYDSDLAEVDTNLKFLKVHRKPHKELPPSYVSMRGVYIFNEKVLAYIPAKTYYEIDHNLLPDAISKGEVFYGYQCSDFLKDVGTMERYKFVEDYLQKQKTV
jgi:mannose-1-phosphate guanylyltransferase